jgi:hypothetical protein
VQKIIHPTPVELGTTPNEPPLMDATAPPGAIGQQVEALPDYRVEQLRAPAAAVEDDGEPRMVVPGNLARSQPQRFGDDDEQREPDGEDRPQDVEQRRDGIDC